MNEPIKISHTHVAVREALIMFERCLATCGLAKSHVASTASYLYNLELLAREGVNQLFNGKDAIDLGTAVSGQGLGSVEVTDGTITIDAGGRSAFAIAPDVMDIAADNFAARDVVQVVVSNVASPGMFVGGVLLAASQELSASVSVTTPNARFWAVKGKPETPALAYGILPPSSETGRVVMTLAVPSGDIRPLEDPRGHAESALAFAKGIPMPAERWWQLFTRPTSCSPRLPPNPGWMPAPLPAKNSLLAFGKHRA